MDAFSDGLERAFISRMFAHLSSDFGPQIGILELDDLALKAMIQRGIARARSHLVVREPDISFYLECMVLLGPDFDERISFCAASLQDETLNGEQKMDTISEHLVFGVDEAR